VAVFLAQVLDVGSGGLEDPEPEESEHLPHLRDRRAARTLSSRPRPPATRLESPTLGLTHLQFEAILIDARDSTNDGDFALVAPGRARRQLQRTPSTFTRVRWDVVAEECADECWEVRPGLEPPRVQTIAWPSKEALLG
jgi:hypothetical protein